MSRMRGTIDPTRVLLENCGFIGTKVRLLRRPEPYLRPARHLTSRNENTEGNRPITPVPEADEGAPMYGVEPPIAERRNCRLTSACFVFFVCGWGDGVTGTVLPYFEAEFHLSYMLSSLLFAAGAVGFAIGTLSAERVMSFLGRFYLMSTKHSYCPAVPFLRRFFPAFFSPHQGPESFKGLAYSASKARFLLLLLGGMIHACFFIIMATRGGYPSLLLGYAVSALARSYLTTSLNSYVQSLPKKPLGLTLACWSTGSLSAPFVCQSIIASGVSWSDFYFISLILSALNISFIFYAFRPSAAEFTADREWALDLIRVFIAEKSGSSHLGSSVDSIDAPAPQRTLLRACKMPYQWAFSLISWIYSGSETTVQGFTVTYLLVVRHANPKTAGYVTSGFWGGMAVSRFLLAYYNPRLSYNTRKLMLQACMALAIAMHLLIRFIDSYLENALSTAVLGLVYGPMFPTTLALANEVLPPDVHMLSMSLISAFSSVGAAFFPFLTGLLSNIKGPHIMSYVAIAQTAALFFLLCLFPSKRAPRSDGVA